MERIIVYTDGTRDPYWAFDSILYTGYVEMVVTPIEFNDGSYGDMLEFLVPEELHDEVISFLNCNGWDWDYDFSV